MPIPPSVRAPRVTWAIVAIAVLAVTGVVLLRYFPRMRARPDPHSAVVVTFGDSLTEGAGSTGRPWPEVLAERLRARARGASIAVVNAGISGNRLLREGYGPSGLERFDRDVLARPGVRWVTVLEGTNDLGFPGSVEPTGASVTADQLIAAYRQLTRSAHAARLKIYGGTLPPFEGASSPGYFTPEKESVRQAVNAWVRTSGEFDAVLDFDAALRDPGRPSRLLPAYDSGDHLHPNDAGHRAMGEAVDLGLFEDGT
jgi:lysophospholipase L1-like esterase